LRPGLRFTEGDQRKASEKASESRVRKKRAPFSAPCWPRPHDKGNSNEIMHFTDKFPPPAKPR